MGAPAVPALTALEFSLPIFIAGLMAMSVVLFALATEGRLRLLARNALAINLVAFLYAATESVVLVGGSMRGHLGLSRLFIYLEDLVIFCFIPLSLEFPAAVLGEGEARSPAGERLRAATRLLVRTAWVLAGLAILASIIRPELLDSLSVPAPNPQGKARLVGRGLPGPLRTVRDIVLLACLVWLPIGTILAARAREGIRSSLVFIAASLPPAWFGIQNLWSNLTGSYFGPLAAVPFSRGLTGIALMALLSAIGAYRRYARESAMLEGERARAAFEAGERRRAEEGREEAESRLAQVFDFLPDPTFAIDAAGRVIVWNRAIAELTGVEAAAMLGKGDYEYALPFFGERRPIIIDLALRPAAEVEATYDSLERQGDTIIAENRNHIVHGGRGAELWGIAAPFRDKAGAVVGAVECIRDITRHKEAERQLAGLAAGLEARMAERSAELTSARDSLVEAEKHAIVGRLGATIAHELNTPLAAILSTAGTWRGEALAAFAAYGDAVTAAPAARSRLDALIEGAARREWMPGGTEERRLRRELEAGLGAAGAERPDILADELADLLPPGECREALAWAATREGAILLGAASRAVAILRGSAIVAEAARKATRVVAAISSFSRREDGPPGPVDLVDALENLLVLYYGSIKRHIVVRTDWAARDLVLGVRDRLDQVWANLINNAIHAMGKGGTLTIATRREGDSLAVTVTDDGRGIPREIAHRVFEPFFTTKATGEGAGLGLDAARRIVEGYGGSVTFTSRPGETSFTVRLRIVGPGAAGGESPA